MEAIAAIGNLDNLGNLIGYLRHRYNKQKEAEVTKITDGYISELNTVFHRVLMRDGDLQKDGLICIVSVSTPKYKPTEPIEDIVYVELLYFDMIVKQLKDKGLRLVERIHCIPGSLNTDWEDENIVTGYNIYMQ